MLSYEYLLKVMLEKKLVGACMSCKKGIRLKSLKGTWWVDMVLLVDPWVPSYQLAPGKCSSVQPGGHHSVFISLSHIVSFIKNAQARVTHTTE